MRLWTVPARDAGRLEDAVNREVSAILSQPNESFYTARELADDRTAVVVVIHDADSLHETLQAIASAKRPLRRASA